MNNVNNSQLIDFLMSLDLDNLPLLLHIPSVVREEILKRKNWTDEDEANGELAIWTDSFNQIEEIVGYKGEVARVQITFFNPGKSDYFWMEYEILNSGKVIVAYESHSGDHPDLFEKFTGKREAFEIDFKNLPKMMDAHIKTSFKIKEQMVKVVEELGYEDISYFETIDEIEGILS